MQPCEKKNIKLFEKKTLIFSIPIQLAFQTTFSHWNIYKNKNYIYTIHQNAMNLAIQNTSTFSILPL
jgi:hypothetical protein